MKFEDLLRQSTRMSPEPAAVDRWRAAIFAPDLVAQPVWLPRLASGLAMAGMLLLLWPAAARGPVGLRAAGVACDGRWEQLQPLRADVRGLAQPAPSTVAFAASDRCGLCHLSK